MNICKYVGVLTVCAALFGCSSDQLPNDTRVRVSPGEKSIAISSTFEAGMFCFTDGGLYQDVPLLISVTDGQDSPLGGAEVGVYADYAGNTFNGVDMLRLYRDANGNGVIDGPDELVTSNTSGVYKATTDKYNGTTSLMLRMFLTCPYSGEIFVFAGSSSISMNVDVSYKKEETIDETTSGESTDTGETDTGETDTGETDSGETDSGETDSGETDAGETDAGESDTGETDAGEANAGESDTGETDSADAGFSDSGGTDVSSVDAGATDVGTSSAGAEFNGLDGGSADE